MSHWSDKWIGLPWREGGRGPRFYDCLGLYLALHRDRFQRELPDPRVNMVRALRQGTAEQQKAGYKKVEVAEEGDALLFRVSGRLLHVGFALDDRYMVHVYSLGQRSAVQDYTNIQWRSRLEGVYRLV